MSNRVSVCDKWGQPCTNQIREPRWRAANVPPCDPVHSFYYSCELMRLAVQTELLLQKNVCRTAAPPGAGAAAHFPSPASRFCQRSVSSSSSLAALQLHNKSNPCLCLGSPLQETQDQLPAGRPAGGSAVPYASSAQKGAEGEERAHGQGTSGRRRRARQRRGTPRGGASGESPAWGRHPWEGQERQGAANQRQTRHREGHQPSSHEEAR